MVSIYTIGFSKKSLREFITRLKTAGVRKVIDVRLHNTSQLAGYAKKEDLEYVLELAGIAYEHRPELAPTEELLKGYKSGEITWPEYEKVYKDLLKKREPLKERRFRKVKEGRPRLPALRRGQAGPVPPEAAGRVLPGPAAGGRDWAPVECPVNLRPVVPGKAPRGKDARGVFLFCYLNILS